MLYVRIFNTNKKLSSTVPQVFHNSYGIQKWLVKHKICVFRGSTNVVDRHKYKALIKEFCKVTNPEFDFTTSSMKSLERFVQNRFNSFCNYVLKKYSQKSLPK